jgi:hypothetical protein
MEKKKINGRIRATIWVTVDSKLFKGSVVQFQHEGDYTVDGDEYNIELTNEEPIELLVGDVIDVEVAEFLKERRVFRGFGKKPKLAGSGDIPSSQ